MTLGENIQAARKNKGLSQEALAEQVGVSRQALGKWEKDTALPSLDNLRALAAVLDVSVDALLGTAQPDGTPEPTMTLDNLRALLDARDIEKQRRTRLWGGAALGVAVVLVCVLAGVAYQYDRQVQALRQSYAMMQDNFPLPRVNCRPRSRNCGRRCARGKPPCWTGTGSPPAGWSMIWTAPGCRSAWRSPPAPLPTA